MKDVKVCGEELAATYLRAGIDRFKGMTPEEVVEGWKAIVPELLREKAARETKPEATPVVETLPEQEEVDEDESDVENTEVAVTPA